MEIMKIIQTLQDNSAEIAACNAEVMAAVDAAIPLLIAQGERIADLEAQLSALDDVGITPEELAFFRSERMSEILKRIYALYEKQNEMEETQNVHS